MKVKGGGEQVIGREAHNVVFYESCVFSRPRQCRCWAFSGKIEMDLIMRKLRIKRFVFRFASYFGKPVLLFLTFIIGVASTILLSEVSPPTVTLCQLAQNPSLYDGRTVRVEADALSIIGSVFISDETCNLPEAASGVWRAQGYEPSSEVKQLYTESDSENYKARILVTGRFNPEATPGCYVPKFAIEATNIELKSAITSEPIEKREE